MVKPKVKNLSNNIILLKENKLNAASTQTIFIIKTNILMEARKNY